MHEKELRVPSMLKSTMEKQETLKKGNRYMSPTRGARMDPNSIHNPFKFIENALKDVKARISNTQADFLENVEDRQD